MDLRKINEGKALQTRVKASCKPESRPRMNETQNTGVFCNWKQATGKTAASLLPMEGVCTIKAK